MINDHNDLFIVLAMIIDRKRSLFIEYENEVHEAMNSVHGVLRL